MSLDSAKPKIKIANPEDIKDRDIPEALNAIYNILYKLTLIQLAIAREHQVELGDELEDIFE